MVSELLVLSFLGVTLVAGKYKIFVSLSYARLFLVQSSPFLGGEPGNSLMQCKWLYCGWLSLFTFLVLQQPKKQYWLALVQQAVKM